GLEVVECDLARWLALVVVKQRSPGDLSDVGSLGLGRHLDDHATASPQATSTARLARLAAKWCP
ncbi:hypothetical protein, partial [Ferrithrix thermotolerans]|uniref:hypothetical protein n=1 Tax=Ferrithrix thermotolerans TaxID=209649 RepID=UPI0015BDD047